MSTRMFVILSLIIMLAPGIYVGMTTSPMWGVVFVISNIFMLYQWAMNHARIMMEDKMLATFLSRGDWAIGKIIQANRLYYTNPCDGNKETAIKVMDSIEKAWNEMVVVKKMLNDTEGK